MSNKLIADLMISYKAGLLKELFIRYKENKKEPVLEVYGIYPKGFHIEIHYPSKELIAYLKPSLKLLNKVVYDSSDIHNVFDQGLPDAEFGGQIKGKESIRKFLKMLCKEIK